jgi:hypothetical protein
VVEVVSMSPGAMDERPGPVISGCGQRVVACTLSLLFFSGIGV